MSHLLNEVQLYIIILLPKFKTIMINIHQNVSQFKVKLVNRMAIESSFVHLTKNINQNSIRIKDGRVETHLKLIP